MSAVARGGTRQVVRSALRSRFQARAHHCSFFFSTHDMSLLNMRARCILTKSQASCSCRPRYRHSHHTTVTGDRLMPPAQWTMTLGASEVKRQQW